MWHRAREALKVGSGVSVMPAPAVATRPSVAPRPRMVVSGLENWCGGPPRVRPAETESPNQWFKRGHRSFPSGEVAEVSAIVTPYVLEYAHDRPAVYALELLPAYDAIARMTSQAHWQTDVLAGLAIGATSGYLAHKRDSPFILGLLPGGVSVGLKKQF